MTFDERVVVHSVEGYRLRGGGVVAEARRISWFRIWGFGLTHALALSLPP